MSDLDNIINKIGDLSTAGQPTQGQSTHTVQVKLADQQADPNSPLYSVKSFDKLGLSSELLNGLYAMNYSKPSQIQERALPLLLSTPSTNMIGQSQSGTGKTATFVLTMLSRVDPNIGAPQAICLAPSRELAQQIEVAVKAMSKFTNISTKLVVKDSLKRNEHVSAQVIVGTPGSVVNVINRRQLSTDAIKIFVLDEADNMLDQNGFSDQSIRIKRQLKSNTQIVLFSATFPENVRTFASKFAPGANEVFLKPGGLGVDTIKQFYMDCNDKEHKYETLCNIYDFITVSQSIIFCKLRTSADEIARRMTLQGHRVVSLHGKMTPEDRDKVMNDFRRGGFKVLITTNVAARGIDIPQISLVINYDLPVDQNGQFDFEAYIHRIGRTGRFGRRGVSFILDCNEETREQINEIEERLQRDITRISTDDWELVEKQLKEFI